MLILPTNISETFIMAESNTNFDDLEDGEIESGDEETTEPQNSEATENVSKEENTKESVETEDQYYSKSGKKKKSKSNKEHKSKDKSKKSRRHNSPVEDDFASNIEKAIRKAMNKNEADDDQPRFDDDRRRYKKRKKHDGKDGSSKKRKKQEYSDEMDESEMMCVRGASPVQRHSPVEMYEEDNNDSYASDSSHESRGNQHRQQRHKPQQQRDRFKNDRNKNDKKRGAHSMQDSDGVCLYYMQGKCHKGDDCIYSHDANPPRKMELCKFYLMDCCAKRDKCLYMHADFPCKYYHTGLPCIYKDDCKFAHGRPLTESLKHILLKHLESAPKEILGDFPRLNREGALKMLQTTQAKLKQEFPESVENQEKTIPSLFELSIPNPHGSEFSMNLCNSEKQNRISPKVRQSRWQNDNSKPMYNDGMSPNDITTNTNVLSLKNLNGVLTPRQISDLIKMGIENLDQLGQLTVLQLNTIGLSFKQITEIQLNTMSIQKLGLINNSNESSATNLIAPTTSNKDLDLRIPPLIPVSSNNSIQADLPGKDVDMRLHHALPIPQKEEVIDKIQSKESGVNKDTIDIDQYTKDALKFASKDKENIDISNEPFENDKLISNESKDVDHRVLPFTDEESRLISSNSEDITLKSERDTDIRFLQPEPLFKNPDKRHRRSTTDDDDDNNLLIDEKWYSSDEEKSSKKKSPSMSPQTFQSPQIPAPHVIEPAAVLNRIGDLSKIDISEEVTKLLNTMKNNLQDTKTENTNSGISSPKSRDPRSRKSPDKVSENVNKSGIRKKSRVSIYECIDGEPTDGRRRTDVDLRNPDLNLPAFGDTDLRQGSSGDIDFRLGLPFKPLPNYTPASEINASINSHPPIPYKLLTIYIPRPDYSDIKNSTAKSQALVDPRLRKVFRLSTEETNSDSEKSSTKLTTTGPPRIDPRRKAKENTEDQKTASLDLQTILQNSNWYKELSSTQKIFVNQHLVPVTQMIKQFQQDKTTGKNIDLSFIQTNSILCNIFNNLGVTLGENGEYTYLPKPKEALLKTPPNINPNPFILNTNMSSAQMDGTNLSLMNIPPMGIAGMNNMNLGNMHGFNPAMSDPRGGPAPGLLGIAPNIPHNYNANNYGGPNNYGNMAFNGPGPGNDFNFVDSEQNYPRFPNRGGHRGRGNDRWNRGGPIRGNRDRKNFNDRGNWKNDRN